MRVFGREYALAYDYLYQDKEYQEECDFLENIFKKSSGSIKKILDLGCGTGGHALILAKSGYEVLGVDCSQEMLDIAIAKAGNRNLSLEFIRGDITEIRLRRKFDAVISMFAVMSYQTTNASLAKVCKIAREHLVSDGLFIFDCWHGSAVLTEKPSMRIKEVKSNKKEKIIRFTEPILNAVAHTVETRFRVLKIQDGHLVSETSESHLMRFLFPMEIKYFLEVAGFKRIEFCPFLELEKPLTENNWNMTVIAEA